MKNLTKYLGLCGSLGYRADAGETAVIARSLDHVEQRITEVMFAELRALRIVPVIDGIDPGAKTYTFTVLDRMGRAAAASERGKDLPRAAESLSEVTSGIKSYGAMYAYTQQELREIAYAQSRGLSIALDTVRAETAARMIATQIDQVVAFGDPVDTRIKGFLTHPSVTVSTASMAWADMTPEELLAALVSLATDRMVASKEVFAPDTIALPTDHWKLVGTTPMGLAANKTVLSFFKEAMDAMGRSVEVVSWPLLATADVARTGPRAVAYKRDPSMVGAIVPLAFQASPPQPKGLEFEIPCEGICGGTAIKVPMSVEYLDGI